LRCQRVYRRLHEGDASGRLDGRKARGAVVELAAEENPDRPGTVTKGGRAEQRIDGRPDEVFTGSGAEPEAAIRDKKMSVGRRDIDHASLDRLAIGRLLDRKQGRSRGDAREYPAAGGGYVDDDRHRSVQIARKTPQNGAYRLQAPHGSAYDD